MKILLISLISVFVFTVQAVAVGQPQQPDSTDAQLTTEEARAAEEALVAADRAEREADAAARSAVVEAEAAARRAEQEAGSATNRAELEAARARLQQARSELELAAQQLARLSADQYAQLENRYVLNSRVFSGFRRPMLGLNISNDEDGVRVVGVSPNGPGADAGVQIGDLIVAVDGLDVSGSSDGNSTRLFFEQLGQIETGSEVTLGVLRDGEPLELSIVTSDRGFPTWIGNMPEHFVVRGADVNVAPLSTPRGN
ncbi:MAG TPA: PDZ domain-containing protein, partial [Gammaproteobacteria bacterium]|nr:PDZ domain-containing protein [Gammaproteobacteria bacterium]